MRVVAARIHFAKTLEHVRAAQDDVGLRLIHLAKALKRALELCAAEFPPEPNFAPNAFQVPFLHQTNARAVPARILDGRALAAELRAELLAQSQALREKGVHPRLAILLAGEDEASLAYVRNLVKTGERAGVAVDVRELPASCEAARIRSSLRQLGADPAVHGAMLQQPLPPHLSIRDIADAMPVHKDVDGTHPSNQGHLAFGTAEFVPATPAAVLLLLERSPHWPVTGKTVAVIGRSVVVGAPVAMLLMARDATVTVLHKESPSLQPYTRMADIVVTATGVPGLLGGADIKPGATVIDVGTTVVGDELKGDVDYDSAAAVAGAITPVPGGVGPVTNIALLRNVIKAALNSR